MELATLQRVPRLDAIAHRDDLRCVLLGEQRGEIGADEARRWKEGVYGLMAAWGLSPHEVMPRSRDSLPHTGWRSL